MRGRKSLTTPHFFDESSAALQFPYYFGENWDAFHDCLTDLEWLRGDTVVVCLTKAVRLLDGAPADASKFARVLEEDLAGCRQRDLAFGTVEQFDAKFLFQPADRR